MALGDQTIDPTLAQPVAQPSLDGLLAPYGGGAIPPPPVDSDLLGAPQGGLVPAIAPQPDLAQATPLDAAPAVDSGGPPGPPPPIDSSLLGSQSQGVPAPLAPLDVPQDLPPPPPYGAPALAPPPAAVRDLPDITVTTEQPGEFTPDALTGAGERLGRGQLVPAGPNLTPEQHYQQTVAQYAADPFNIPDAGEQQRYLNDLALRDPGAFAAAQLKHENDRQQFINRRRQEIAEADYQAQRQAIEDKRKADEITQKKLDALIADSDRLAKTKIDRTGGLDTGQKIAGILAAFVGGLVQGKTGAARNAGLDALEATINRGIEAQRAEIAAQQQGIASKRNALSEELARHGDAYHAQDVLRIAYYNKAIGQLQFEAQNYDPRGTTALRIAQTTQDIQARRAAAIQTASQRNFENELKRQNAIREAALAENTIANNRAQLGLGYARLAEDRAQREQAERFKREEKQAAREDKAAETERQLSIGTLPRVKLDEKGKPVVGANGAPVVESGAARQADGSVYLAPDATTRKELADKTLAASEINDIINEVLDIRAKVGGETDLANSPEAQRLHVLKDRITLIAKSGTQGLSSDKDLERIEGALGAKNVASFRDQTAGLEAARERVNAELNKQYRIAKYTGARIEFPNKFGPTTRETGEDVRTQRLFEKPSVSFDREVGDELKRRTIDFTPEQLRGSGYGGYSAEFLRQRDEAERDVRALYNPDISIEQQREIARLGSVAGGDTAEAAAARTLLQSLKEKGQTGAIRRAADGALRAGIDAAVPGAQETVRGSSGPIGGGR